MEQIIYIEQNDRDEATKLSKSFTLKEISERAYVNALGAEIAMKYLAQANINVSNAYNLHNINKIREEFDIADIMLPNIHLDVRMVYNEDEIFVPKSHFEYNLLPDIYLVFEVAKDSTHVKFLGFFEPKLINKNNKNKDYYFIEKEKLSNPDDLKNFIENFNGNTTQATEEDEIELGQKLALSLIDNNISKDNKKELIEMLKKSSVLRQDLIEFDNFELISYHTSQIEDFKNPDINISTQVANNIDEFDMFDTPFEAVEATVQTETPTIDVNPIENLSSPEPIEGLNPIEDVTLQEPVLETLDTLEPIETIGEIDTLEPIDTIESIQPIEELNPIEDITLQEPTLETANSIESIANIEAIDILEPIDTTQPTQEINTIEELTVTEAPIQEPTLEALNSPDPIKNIETIDAIEPIDSVETIDSIEPIEDNNTVENVTFEPIAELNQTQENNTDIPVIETLDTFEALEALKPIEEVNSIEEIQEPVIETPQTNIIQDLINEEREISADIEYTENSNDPLDTLFNSGEEYNAKPTKTNNTPPPPPQPNKSAETYQIPQEEVNTNKSFENSRVISNQNITVGEIPIDINNNDTTMRDQLPEAEQTYETPIEAKPQGNKKILTAIVLLAIIGSGLAYTLLNKKPASKNIAKNIPDNITKEIPQLPPTVDLEDVTLPPIEPNKTTKKEVQKPSTKATKAEAKKEITKPATPKGPAIETPYLEVKKISWSIPDYLSYNDTFKSYLQTAGKSLKLSLSSDLLLATEYSYSNKLQVDIKLSKEGSIQDVTMLQSSGSTQIDNIVLRTVKETLTILKAPNDAIVGDKLNLTLIIYL